MKGQAEFSRLELDQLALLLREKQTADRDHQKILRARMRRLNFYISDFASDSAGFTAPDLDVLVARRVITVKDRIGSSTSFRIGFPRRKPECA